MGLTRLVSHLTELVLIRLNFDNGVLVTHHLSLSTLAAHLRDLLLSGVGLWMDIARYSGGDRKK